jgi:hypothetical protein
VFPDHARIHRNAAESFNRRRWTVLTDDYALVDNLLAPLFAERVRYQKR